MKLQKILCCQSNFQAWRRGEKAEPVVLFGGSGAGVPWQGAVGRGVAFGQQRAASAVSWLRVAFEAAELCIQNVSSLSLSCFSSFWLQYSDRQHNL